MDFSKPIDNSANTDQESDVKKEVMQFASPCPSCFNPGMVKMCVATIPFFKEIIIMAYTCDTCGHRSSEIKQGGGISDKASKITFKIEKPEDINRDVFKSDTAAVMIPEVDLELAAGTLGSVYTTVEGVLTKIADVLEESNPFGKGDSSMGNKFSEFVANLRKYS